MIKNNEKENNLKLKQNEKENNHKNKDKSFQYKCVLH